MERIFDLLMTIWFVFVALVFWGPYTSLNVPVGLATAVYAVFLLIVIARLTLWLLAIGRNPKEESPSVKRSV